jgi:hypothetical protein
MSKLFLAAGVAALAIAVPSVAKPGGGHGGGGPGGGNGQSAQPKQGGGGGHGAEGRGGGGGFKAERRGGGGDRAFVMQRSGQQEAERRGGSMRIEHAMRPARHEPKARHADRASARADRHDRVKVARQADRHPIRVVDRRNDARVRVTDRDLRRTAWNDRDRWVDARGLANRCPPGLAMKNNGCLPPGQARKLIGAVLPAAYAGKYLPDGLRDLYRDDDEYYYRYGDGYLYRVDRQSNLVNELLPLFGGGYAVGQPYPLSYSGYPMPSYYQPFYQDSPYDYYRYNNGYVYDIDRRTGLIENIIPAMGYGYGVGEMLPASYSYYNLPYQYRDVYADNDDYYYRYAPGAIYQVDRDTSLITSVASLLSGGTGLGVGQPLPMGYSAYNVPYAYRDRYYDTPDAMYRYANGNIYQVDPTTQLITAVIDALV